MTVDKAYKLINSIERIHLYPKITIIGGASPRLISDCHLNRYDTTLQLTPESPQSPPAR